MRTFKLTIAYDGGAYAGWQCQVNQATLQGTLENTLAKITGEGVSIAASGRTDAGVHALGQVVSFCSKTPLSAAVLQKALNASLPRDIEVLEACEAPLKFHARRDAKRKRYRYNLDDGPLPDIFSRNYAWRVPTRLDAAAMQRAARHLAGKHDFSSFETSGSPRQTSVRTIYEIAVERGRRAADNRVSIDVEADGFLYNMVRAIAGTLVQVGRGVQDQSWVADVLAAQDRRAAGRTAPPHGLFLVRVDY